jgi:hypothetical protein
MGDGRMNEGWKSGVRQKDRGEIGDGRSNETGGDGDGDSGDTNGGNGDWWGGKLGWVNNKVWFDGRWLSALCGFW